MTAATLTRTDVNKIQEQLWQVNTAGKPPIVYVILGGARDKQIERILREGSLRSVCLIEGRLIYSLAVVAPYIVRLEQGHPQTFEIIQKGWGNSWGIFATAYPPASFLGIRQNCKKIAKVNLPDNKQVFFRYYDPRVMRPYLPTCTADEAKQVFGDISEYIMEGEAPGTMHRFKRTEEGVVDVGIVLTDQPSLDSTITNATITDTAITNATVTDADIAELNEINAEISEKVGHDIIRQATGLLKLAPLPMSDPTNQNQIDSLIGKALVYCDVFNLSPIDKDSLKSLALAVELWGEKFYNEEPMKSVLYREGLTVRERIAELYRVRAFEEVGSHAIDFPTYCIIRYQDRNIDDASAEDIFLAATIGLKIAEAHHIKELDSTYFCVELVLVSGSNYMEDEAFHPMKQALKNNQLTSVQKIDEAYEWLTQHLATEQQQG
jgi:hypothetical protein